MFFVEAKSVMRHLVYEFQMNVSRIFFIFHLDCYLFLISQYRLCQPKQNQKRELNGSVSLNLNFFVDIPVDIYYCACRELNIAEDSTNIRNQS